MRHGRQEASSGGASSGRLARRRRDQGRAPREDPMTQAMTIETRQAPGRRRPAQCPCFPFGAKGASTGQDIRQRLPFWCNKTKTSRAAGWKSPWSPGRRHHQSLWQTKTNFSQDKCTRCSPSKWSIVGALPAHYLGRGPGPSSINRTSHHSGKALRDPVGIQEATELTQVVHRTSSRTAPREAVLPLYCSSSVSEAIHHTTNQSRVLHHNGGPN